MLKVYKHGHSAKFEEVVSVMFNVIGNALLEIITCVINE